MAGESETCGVPEVRGYGDWVPAQPYGHQAGTLQVLGIQMGSREAQIPSGEFVPGHAESRRDHGERLQRQSREGAGRGAGGPGISGKGGNKWTSLGCHGFENLFCNIQ